MYIFIYIISMLQAAGSEGVEVVVVEAGATEVDVTEVVAEGEDSEGVEVDLEEVAEGETAGAEDSEVVIGEIAETGDHDLTRLLYTS